MELFILIISVPLFLIIVLLLSVFVLANYSGNEPAKADPAEVKEPDTSEGADHVVT
jgi:flagellar basal body-associated protein FliL